MPDNALVGMFLIGVAIGVYLPNFPAPAEFLNTYLGIILVLLAVVLFVKG